MLQRVFIICLTLLCVSCANFVPPLKSSASPDPKKAYVYGRFSMNSTPLRIGIEITGPKVYLLEFKTKQPVSMIAIEPGTYKLNRFVFTTLDASVSGESSIDETELTATVELVAGTAYYIGDFSGEAHANFNILNWEVTSVANRFDATTREIDLKYPQFSSLPKQPLPAITTLRPKL